MFAKGRFKITAVRVRGKWKIYQLNKTKQTKNL